MNKKVVIIGNGGFGTLAKTRKLVESMKVQYSDPNIHVPESVGERIKKACDETNEAVQKLSLALNELKGKNLPSNNKSKYHK